MNSRSINYRDRACVKAHSVIVWVDEQGIARARDGAIGGIVAESSDHASVIQAAMDSVGPVGGTIFIKKGLYTIKRPITFADWARVRIKGELSYSSSASTVLRVDSTFPDSRYVFECVRQDPTKTNAIIDIEDIYMWNPNWSSVKAGFLYWAGPSSGYHGGPKVRRCVAHYAWRGVHVKGEAYGMVIEDFTYLAAATSFTADAVIAIEKDPSLNWIATSWIHRLFVFVGGKLSNAIRIDGSSIHARDVMVLGGAIVGNSDNFSDAVIRLGKDYGAWTNYLDGIHISDVSGEQTALILDGVDASNPLTRNNRVVFASMVAKYVRFRNSAYNNTVIVRQSPDGTPTIDDAEAGPGNTVIVEPGSRLWSQSEAGKIAAAKCRVIDLRPGASAAGAATIPAGSTSATVNHGLLAAP